MNKIGLRIDVDTLRGTRLGVPALCTLLAEYGYKASFFFSVGPDNMGRHLWRLVRPSFFLKMMRTDAASLYGWDILLKGTFWKGPSIAKSATAAIKQASDAGHEIGIHAWDHHAWQAGVAGWSQEKISVQLQKAAFELESITNSAPVCAAAPAWRCTNNVLEAREKFSFAYASDCRGNSICVPAINGRRLKTPQVPTTLPTYDELIGSENISNDTYNDHLMSFIKPGQLNILTIHAEVEGIVCSTLFRQFMESCYKKGFVFCPLGELVPEDLDSLPTATIVRTEIPGRDGWISMSLLI